MSDFEKLVFEMRKSQKRYEENPTEANLLTMKINEEDVDEELDFKMNCHATTYSEVKAWMEKNGY